MKQGLEDANLKLNTLVDHLNLPATYQGASSHGMCPSALVVPAHFQDCSLHVAPCFVPTSDSTTSASLLNGKKPFKDIVSSAMKWI